MAEPDVVTERFPANTGRVLGYLALAVIVGVVVLSAPRTTPGELVRLVFGGAALGILIWMSLLRPHAYATANFLVLRNTASDTIIPLAAIERATVRQALNVWAHGKRYLCVGIAQPRRVVYGRKRRQLPGSGRGNEVVYDEFIGERIEMLAKNAREAGQEGGPVRRVPAAVELGVLAFFIVAFVVSMVV